MATPRRNLIRLQVLEILDQCLPYLVPVESTLLQQLNLQLVPPAIVTELRDVLAEMETNREVVQIRSRDGVKAKITDEGQAARLQR